MTTARLVLESLHKLSATFGQSQAISVAATGVVECLRGLALGDDRIVQRTPRPQQRTARFHKLRRHRTHKRERQRPEKPRQTRDTQLSACAPGGRGRRNPRCRLWARRRCSPRRARCSTPPSQQPSAAQCPGTTVPPRLYNTSAASANQCACAKTWAARDAHRCMRWRGREARRRRRRWGRARPAVR